MQLLSNLFILSCRLSPNSGLRMVQNGLGPGVFGVEGKIVDYAILAADQKGSLPSQV